MTEKTKFKLVNARQTLQRSIADLDRRIQEVATGAASASVSSGTGSKSYTNHSLSELRAMRESLVSRLNHINNALASGSTFGVRHVVTTRR